MQEADHEESSVDEDLFDDGPATRDADWFVDGDIQKHAVVTDGGKHAHVEAGVIPAENQTVTIEGGDEV